MRKKLIYFLLIISIAISSTACNSKKTAPENVNEQTESSQSEDPEKETAKETDTAKLPENQPSKEQPDSSSDSDKQSTSTENIIVSRGGPDDIELMSYAQTVLENNISGCVYSRNTDDYNFVKTNLRYKIEGEVSKTKEELPENFYMIIEFTDDSYEIYDLISLEIGGEVYYKASSSGVVSPSGTSANDILNEKNTQIYNEVLSELSANSDLEEDEVFEKIAPNYDMSASELKDFMFKYMEAYFE